MTENGNTAVIHYITYETVASARNNQIDQGIFLQHLCDVFPGFEQLYRISREGNGLQCTPDTGAERLICTQSFTAALQQDGISAFYTKRRNLDQCIGTTLKDDANHADRTGNPVKIQIVSKFSCTERASDGVGKCAQRMQPANDLSQLFFSECKTMQKRSRQIGSGCFFKIGTVGSKDRFPVFIEYAGKRCQRFVPFAV